MPLFIRWRAVLVSLLLLCGAMPAWPDIRDTKHNLSGNAGALSPDVSKDERKRLERQVCVFCHTPGQAELSELAEGQVTTPVPLPKWQRSVEPAFSFELFDDIGRLGGDLGGANPVGSVSMGCLSCHDSVQAFGVAPGSGSDHPFGVPYRGYGDRGGATAREFRDRLVSDSQVASQIGTKISDESEFRPVRSGVVNKREIWWAAMNDTGQRTKNDLPLYPRRVNQDYGGYKNIPFVECTSCHDPHSSREVFLRTSNEESRLCTTCHVK